MSHRIEKVNQLLKKEVGQLIHQETDFDDIWITVTKVDASPDLSQAKIKITVMPENKSEEALKTIKENIGSLQKKINRRLNMKWVPYLIFEIDKGEVAAQKLEKTLKNKR